MGLVESSNLLLFARKGERRRKNKTHQPTPTTAMTGKVKLKRHFISFREATETSARFKRDFIGTVLQVRQTMRKSSVGILPSWRLTLIEAGRLISTLILWSVFTFISIMALYYALASPPMHLIYDVAPSPAGPSSVYVPGGGFSGFWFHLGYLQSIPNIHDYDFYCFSSGCLGVLAALMNMTLDETAQTAFHAQSLWRAGNVSRFELVDHFFDQLVPEEEDRIQHILPNIKVLITTQRDGHQVGQAKDPAELKDFMIKTTWM